MYCKPKALGGGGPFGPGLAIRCTVPLGPSQLLISTIAPFRGYHISGFSSGLERLGIMLFVHFILWVADLIRLDDCHVVSDSFISC